MTAIRFDFDLLIRSLVAWGCVIVIANPMLDARAHAGDIDPTYGNGLGKLLITAVGSNENLTASLVQADDKLLIVGACTDATVSHAPSMCVSRRLPNGQLDLEFGVSGVLHLVNTGCRGFDAVRVIEDGNLVLSGSFSEQVSAAEYLAGLCAVRLSSSGTLDTNFGNAGIVRVAVLGARSVEMTDLRVMPDGKIVVAGSCQFPGIPQSYATTNFCVTRLLSSGDVDGSIGEGGTVLVRNSFDNASLYTLNQTANGLYFVGWCWNTTGSAGFHLCVTKTNFIGAVDASWATQGTYAAILPSTTSCQANEVAFEPDAAVLVAASCDTTTSRRGFAIRLLANGSPDATFGASGVVAAWGSDLLSGFGSILKNKNGKTTYFSGRCGGALASNSPCIWRMLASGAADSSFGINGVARVMFPPTVRAFGRYSINQQSNGKLVFAMSCSQFDFSDKDFCFGRLRDAGGYFDVDSDNASLPNSDTVLYIRHLLGFRDAALTSGAVGTYADRASATDIATYLSTPNPTYPNCSASIVGAPGGPQAMIDGIVLLRALMGLTGDAVTNGIAFPAGTTRTSWVDIKAHLNDNCGMALN